MFVLLILPLLVQATEKNSFKFDLSHEKIQINGKDVKTTNQTLDELFFRDQLKEKENNIEHRLTKPNTPKTNGMVERVNGTIKNRTILKEIYVNKNEMNSALIAFLVHYILYRRHGGLRTELNVKTPMQAIEKCLPRGFSVLGV
jgi:hypothetical protein